MIGALGILGQIGGLSSGSSAPAWTPATALGGELPDYKYVDGTRSGLTLPNAMSPGTGDLSILPACFITAGNTQYFDYAGDNSVWDIGDDSFTMISIFKNRATPITTNIFGKQNTPGDTGSGSFIIYQTSTGAYHAYLVSSGGVKDIGSDNITDNNYHVHEMRIDNVNKILSYFIDGTQVGSDTAFTGTFASVSGGHFGMLQYGASYAQRTAYTQCALYRRLLTPTERTNSQNGILPVDSIGHWIFTGLCCTDISGNNRHLTPTGVTTLNQDYDSKGSSALMDYGYTIYEKAGNKDIHIPFTVNGVRVTSPILPSGYAIKSANPDVSGDATKYNKANSYIDFTGIDRSNTTICSYLARDTNLKKYYLSGHVTYIHSFETTNRIFSNYFNTGYRGKRAFKESDGFLTDIVVYSTNKTGSDYDTLMKWTGETILKFDAVVGPHICAVNGAKVLKFDDTHTFSLSLDSGVTYSYSLLTTLSSCDFAFICDDGTIAFADATKIYYSDDNLSTYQESTVTGADGDPFVPGTLGNFRSFIMDTKEITIGTKKMVTWGNYATSGTAEFDNINQWYTIDSFRNVKSGYKFGYSTPSLVCRHIHDVTYYSTAGKFYMSTGDDMGDAVERNNLMEGTYDEGTDTFTWSLIGKGLSNSVWQGVGIAFMDNYIYTTGEDDSTYKGIRRILYSDLANFATHQTWLYTPSQASVSLIKLGDYMIMCEGGTLGSNNIVFSLDGETFFMRAFDDFTVRVPYGGYIPIGKLDNGYYVFQCVEDGETIENYTKGGTLLIKPSIIS